MNLTKYCDNNFDRRKSMSNSSFGLVTALFLVIIRSTSAPGQCDAFFPEARSQRPANYDISLKLDDPTKTIEAEQTIRFVNHSPQPIRELRLYLYLNAFKNTESTFLKGASNIFGQPFAKRKPEEWAWVDIVTFERQEAGTAVNLRNSLRYVQPDDGNPSEQSVLEITRDRPLLPADTGVYHLPSPARMPNTIPRAGYSPCEKVNTILADNIIKGIASQPIRGGKTVEVHVTRGVAADADAEKKRDRLQARIREAQVEWANAKRLAVKGLLDDDDVAAVKAETEAIISEARTTLEEVDQAGRGEVVPFTGAVADRFAELVDGLSDEEVPAELRKSLLRDFGITRIYVDNPSVRVELL